MGIDLPAALTKQALGWYSKKVIDSSSTAFRERAAYMSSYLARVRGIEDRKAAREEKHRSTAHERKKLLPRERLGRLLDRGAPFLEIAPLAGYQMYDDP